MDVHWHCTEGLDLPRIEAGHVTSIVVNDSKAQDSNVYGTITSWTHHSGYPHLFFTVNPSPEMSASSGRVIALYLCFDERMNLWWIISLQQRANDKCTKVNSHCHCDCLSSVIREEFRKGQCVLGQEGSQMVKGMSSTSSLPF